MTWFGLVVRHLTALIQLAFWAEVKLPVTADEISASQRSNAQRQTPFDTLLERLARLAPVLRGWSGAVPGTEDVWVRSRTTGDGSCIGSDRRWTILPSVEGVARVWDGTGEDDRGEEREPEGEDVLERHLWTTPVDERLRRSTGQSGVVWTEDQKKMRGRQGWVGIEIGGALAGRLEMGRRRQRWRAG